MADIDVDADLVGGSSAAAEGTVRFATSASLSGGSGLVSTPTVVVGPVTPVRPSASPRQVTAGRLVFDQIDLFQVDGMTRVQDVAASALFARLFFNDKQVNWPVVSGVGVPDLRVAAGKVYWTEISAGFYSVRFFPNAVGNWRLLLTYAAGNQAVSLTYQTTPLASPPGGPGLRASFFRRV